MERSASSRVRPSGFGKNFPPACACRDGLESFLVISSMTVSRLSSMRSAFTAAGRRRDRSSCLRHGTCTHRNSVEHVSRSRGESVDFFHRPAKPKTGQVGGFQTGITSWPSLAATGCGWQRGAVGCGHCKRTRVREACGGAIRPSGGGIHSSHGHFGRSIAGHGFRQFREPGFCVVKEPARDDRGRHFSRGAGVPAAALTRPTNGFVRMSAPADRTAPATRRRSPVVNRAASMPAASAGASRGWRRRTRPGPRTRLRPAN